MVEDLLKEVESEHIKSNKKKLDKRLIERNYKKRFFHGELQL